MLNLRLCVLFSMATIGMATQLVFYMDGKDNLNVYLIQRAYGKNWTDSQKFCRSLGMELASIHSRDEHNAVRNHVMGRDIFMGGREIRPEEKRPNDQRIDTWTWSDGTPFDYYQWQAGQPDNKRMAESCLAFHADGYFHDFECFLKRLGFICKASVGSHIPVYRTDPRQGMLVSSPLNKIVIDWHERIEDTNDLLDVGKFL